MKIGLKEAPYDTQSYDLVTTFTEGRKYKINILRKQAKTV